MFEQILASRMRLQQKVLNYSSGIHLHHDSYDASKSSIIINFVKAVDDEEHSWSGYRGCPMKMVST